MSAKSRKSLSPWLQCDKCQSVLTQKSLSLHENDCPPCLENVEREYSFILNGILYSTVELYQPQVIYVTELPNHISEKTSIGMVFISSSAMQVCNIAIGDAVVVETNNAKVVKTAFPTNDTCLTSASLTKQAIDLDNLNGPMKIYLLEDNIHIAKEIVLKQLSKHSICESIAIEVDIILKCFNEHKIFTLGNRVMIPFYGRKLMYETVQIKTEDGKKAQIKPTAENNLSTALERINLETKSSEMTYFKALYSTKWTILPKKEVEESSPKKTYKINDIAGYDALISDIRDIVQIGIGKYKSVKNFGANKGVLLHGPSGVGKSLIANAIISECNAKTFIVYSSDIYSKSIGETENRLKEIFNKAISTAPSIILLEDLDSLCPMKSNNTTDHERRILAQLTALFDDLHSTKSDVLVMGTTSKLYSVDSSLRRPGRIDVEFEIYVPTPNMRLEILTKLISKIPNTLSEQDVQVLSLNTHGFVGADLHGLCSKAIFSAVKRQERKALFEEHASFDIEPIVAIEDFDCALITTKPSAMKEVLVEIPSVKWSDIGGQKDLKLKLKQAVEWPLKFPDAFRKMGITPPKGILMYGPPGCSKTMIAKALATESRVNFLNIKGPELFSKWVGESEKAVREVFRRARQVAPSIVFIDEIDALGGERSSSSGGSGSNVQERVLAQLLIELDGIVALGSVTLVAATNRPDKIDKALLRPGRLDRIIYVGLPDEETRQEIFIIKLQKMPIAKEVDVTDLVWRTNGYTGAEIHAICHEAAMKALEENINAETVTKKHFETALTLITPRTSSSLIKLYEDYRNNVL
ncbi:ATPase family protein 2 homolog [Odontomachus brunneus]|uniref:ATPase family protein 2 homolog n=1 Tax=Odontomachus brunneus TaxID=486640 RepID=UPI0013F18724|nr:ATPase family protein 2 homolog [Odontomachus brunneus]XP_032670565.1 ATPase family protein 2 homolog [Odontomachus brunneus]XP_032670567.1 ATPase family protein 2 homolog [Odontomachus brunneus]